MSARKLWKVCIHIGIGVPLVPAIMCCGLCCGFARFEHCSAVRKLGLVLVHRDSNSS